MEKTEILVRAVLDHTRKGPIYEWCGRLADLADEIGLKCEMINWFETPHNVANQIVRLCGSAEMRATLERAMMMAVRKEPCIPRIVEKTKKFTKLRFPTDLRIRAGDLVQLSYNSDGEIGRLDILSRRTH